MHPIARISGLSAFANDRIISIECKDEDGVKSDTCTIRLDDRDSMLEPPAKGTKFKLEMGYLETGLVDMGTYVVESVSWKTPPDEMTINGKSADMYEGKLKQQRSKHFKDKSIKDIVGEIAGRHGLEPVVRGRVAGIDLKSIAIQRESDMHFLTRLAKEHDATFTVKGGKMIFSSKGESFPGAPIMLRGRNAGGIVGFAMFPGNIIEAQGHLTGRDAHQEIESEYWDRDKAKIKTEKSKSGEKGPNGKLRHLAPSKGNAQHRSKGAGSQKVRNRGQLSITVAGDPTVSADKMAIVMGLRSSFDGPWRVKAVVHCMTSDKAFTSQIELDKPNAADAKSNARVAQNRAFRNGFATPAQSA